ncbi:M20/M25/M40 family metallo-hydrolase [bacterium]|nr:M20/M25/M40 family metallo-hydrolase [bacterium]
MKPYVTVFLFLLAIDVAANPDQVNLSVIHRIKQEAFPNGKVMDHLFYLTDVNGPRLSGSPEYQSAAEWTVKQLQGWGITNSRLESWGQFGRSWSLQEFNTHMTKPSYTALHAFPLAWSPPTAGVVKGDVVYTPLLQKWEEWLRSDPTRLLEKIRAFESKYKGQLRGKIVLVDPPRELSPPTEPAFKRFSEQELTEMTKAPEPFVTPDLHWPVLTLPEDEKKREEFEASLPLEIEADLWEQQQKSWDQFNAFLASEGVLAMLTASRRGIGGTLYAQEGSSWHSEAPLAPPSFALEPEQYTRMIRLVEKSIPVQLEIDLQVSTPEKPVEGMNVIAEIPGGKKKDEVVMMGAHLDSWHSGTGATDNAAGCAVVLEASRILKTLNLSMDRTVRLALWSGEEQGLYGSRGYVQKHFADPVTMKVHPEHSKLSGYFNIDNGTGKIRGVYLQGNDMMRPIFEDWFAPFEDLGVSTLTIRNTSGTDHLSFDAVGIPGFQFIQEPAEYRMRTHHSNIDLYDHAQPADLMQASAVLASVVYHAANRSELLPRKPLPKPLPPKTKSN